MNREERIEMIETAKAIADMGGYKYEMSDEEKKLDEDFIEGVISLEEYQEKMLERIKAGK